VTAGIRTLSDDLAEGNQKDRQGASSDPAPGVFGYVNHTVEIEYCISINTSIRISIRVFWWVNQIYMYSELPQTQTGL